MRRFIRHSFGFAAAGLTLALAAQTPAQAETGAAPASVTVHRGAQVGALENGVERPADAAAAPSGVTVLRGHGPVPRAGPEVVVVREAPGVPLLGAGEVVWLLDADEDRLIACELVETANYGASKIRCRSRDLPR